MHQAITNLFFPVTDYCEERSFLPVNKIDQVGM